VGYTVRQAAREPLLLWIAVSPSKRRLANRRPSHYPVVGSRKNLSIPIGTLPCGLAPCIRLPTRLHPALRSGTSSVDGCQRREHLTLRPGVPCVDCRLVCTQPCGRAPRLSTVANTVGTLPCGVVPRALTAGVAHPVLRPDATSLSPLDCLSTDRSGDRRPNVRHLATTFVV
jgi:hypothetical protein